MLILFILIACMPPAENIAPRTAKRYAASSATPPPAASRFHMTVHDIRALLARDKPTVGTWLQLPSTDVASSWRAPDTTGWPWTWNTAPSAAPACRISSGPLSAEGAAPSFARLPEAAKARSSRAGSRAQGLIFPMIESREQLGRAIDWSCVPVRTVGAKAGKNRRGISRRGLFHRANVFGKDFENYHGERAPRAVPGGPDRHIRAVDNLDAILTHPRLDAIMVGPYDLSGSMGLTAQFDHPDFQAAMARIQAACRKHKARMGLHIVQPDPAELARQVAAGSRFIAYGIDSVFLWQGAERPCVEN